jgi:hypothetical protein
MFKFINEQGCRGRRGMQWHISKSIVGASKYKLAMNSLLHDTHILYVHIWVGGLQIIIPSMNDKRRKVA